MLKSYEIEDAEFGVIPVRTSTRARRLLLKAQKGVLTIVLPANFAIEDSDLCDIVEKNRVALRRMLSRTKRQAEKKDLYDGREINFPEGRIVVRATEDVKIGEVRVYCPEKPRLIVEYNPHDDISLPNFHRLIVRAVERLMVVLFGDVLRALVAEQASRLNLGVADVRIGKGRRVLGHCSRRGVITISVFALFLPVHLRMYLVCHELAHLTHFNHSESFHKLCDLYCGGKGFEWRKELKSFVFPISQ